MILQEWLAQGEAHLRSGPHPDRARRDAETLLLHVIRSQSAALVVGWKEVLDEQKAARYAALVERRRLGEPIQYILGETEFYGLPFRVTPAVLIPRPETEHLIEQVLELAAHFPVPRIPAPRIVDVGTGSGCIAVALTAKLPFASITAIELSPPALALARRNAERNSVHTRIRFLKGDLLKPVHAEQFEIVVSNPPYVPITDRPTLAVEVREHEPPLALFAGLDGLDVCRRFIPESFAALVSGGFLALEIGHGQEPQIRALLTVAGFQNIEFAPDLQGIPRVAIAQRP